MNQSLAIEATSFPATSLQVAVNAPGRDQLTRLMLAVLNSKEQVVPALLAAGADPNTAEQVNASIWAAAQMDGGFTCLRARHGSTHGASLWHTPVLC